MRFKQWVQNRFYDGTYSLQLYEFKNGYLIDSGQEVRRWWIRGNEYFEQGYLWPLSTVHHYRFEIIDSKKIQFNRSDGYQFIDQKINDAERPYPEPATNSEDAAENTI